MHLLILFIASVQSNCTFYQPFTLHCDSIKTFPDIDRRGDTVYIDIENSLLTELPLFTHDKWPKLEFLTFKHNRLLPCTEILKQMQDHIFYIDHDCNRTMTTEKPDHVEEQTNIYIVLPC